MKNETAFFLTAVVLCSTGHWVGGLSLFVIFLIMAIRG